MRTVEERFWPKVNKDGPLPYHRIELGKCWIWTSAEKAKGYGGFWLRGKPVRAHRVSYEIKHGLIPTGLHLDHLCRNTMCVNPNHLEAVTKKENTLRGESFSAINIRKTHCLKGHALQGDNLTIEKRGGRACRLCHKTAMRKNYLIRKIEELK